MSKKYLDTRDLDERLTELEGFSDMVDSAKTLLAEAEESKDESAITAAEEELDTARLDFGEGEEAELKVLQDLRDKVGSEWSDGVTLIPESEFVAYCRELLEDCGDIPKNLPHYITIDWDDTADNIKVDYSEIEYDGDTYLFLS